MTRAAFYLGNATIATDAFLRLLGFEVVKLPTINKNTINKGVSHSPEFACFPFKISVGMLFEAIAGKADVFIVPGGNSAGACQLAEFGVAQEYIMKRLEKQGLPICDIVIIDSFNVNELLKKLKKYNPELSLTQLSTAALVAGQKLLLLEYLDELYYQIYIASKKRTAELFKRKWEKRIDETDKIADLYMFKRIITEDRQQYPALEAANPLKIAIIGDIQCINEAFINNHIFEKLCDLGVYPKQTIPVSMLLGGAEGIPNTAEILLEEETDDYLKHNVGAFSRHSIKNALHYAKLNYDGIIHIYPFNCMAEIVVRNILPKISNTYNIPILYLSIDEQTGDAGFTTRIEAFVDLIKIKKQKTNIVE